MAKHIQKDIQLGGGFEFTFGDSPFASALSQNELPDQNTQHFLGWEYCAGKLTHPSLTAAFSEINVTFFCLPETSLQTAVLVENILKRAGPLSTPAEFTSAPEVSEDQVPVGQGFDQVFVDLPRMTAPLLPAVLKSFPHCVALAESSVVASETFLGNGLDAQQQLSKRPVCYFESLDTRRLLLVRLLEQQRIEKNIPVHVFGGTDALLQWQLLPAAQDDLVSCPPQLLLPLGILPFLEARFFLARQQLKTSLSNFYTEPAEELLSSLLKVPAGSRVLVVVDAPALLALANLATQNKALATPQAMVGDLASARRTREQKNRGPVELWALTPANNSEFARMPGFLSTEFLKQAKEKSTPLDWLALARQGLSAAFLTASTKFEDWTKLKMGRSQERDYFRFAHRLAAEEDLLFPRTFDLLLAARSVVDSNFAYELLQLCRAFPTNEAAEAALPVLEVPLQEIFKKTTTLSVKQFETILRHKPRTSLRAVRAKKQKNPLAQPVSESKYADNSWVHSDHPYSCSFPDEDIFMEDFAFAYRKQAREKVRARETHLSELQHSIKDGLDIRETVRHWHSQQIIVREELNVGKADVGSIVFNFAEPGTEEKYSWQSFWLAEQHDNSNLMFYATPFQEQVIGPGVAKSEFGGFAVIPLPSYGENPWNDAYVRAQSFTPAEALLLAGALATEHRSVLYIDNHPPHRRVADLLKRGGKTIIHVRLAELPPDKIRRVRTFHILAEAGVREYAEKYIRKE